MEAAAIEFDAIPLESKSDVVTRQTNFAVIPSELVVVENSNGLFLYDMLERAIGVPPERVSESREGVKSDVTDASI